MVRPLLLALLLSSLCLAQTPINAPDKSSLPEDIPQPQHFDPLAVDKNIAPCDDFYAYACNKWLAANPIPPDRGTFGRGSQIFQRNQYSIHSLLEEAANAKNPPNSVKQKIGDYYAACMDTNALARQGVASLKPELDRIDAMKTKADLPVLVAHLHAITINLLPSTDSQQPTAFFGFGYTQDLDDASLTILGADQGGMGLPDRDYYLKDDAKSKAIRDKYRAHVQRMFELSGDIDSVAAREADTVLTIETALAQGAMDIVKRRDPSNLNHKMSLAELKSLTPTFNWDAYLKELNAPTPHHYLVTTPSFMQTVDGLIAQKDLDDLKIYLRWNLLLASRGSLPEPFAQATFDFYGKILVGSQEIEPRWKRCSNYVDRDLGEALGQVFVEKNFPPESKQNMLRLVNQLEAALQKDIDGLPWMTPATKKQAVIKLKGILDKIGYPDQWRDYSSVDIKRNDAAGNAFRAGEFEMRRQLNKVGKPVDRKEWGMTPPTVDAYYNAQMNTINFPAGILQAPIFEAKMDDAVNLGGIGTIIGHELTHGFDDQGRKFDAEGNLRDWWTPEDAKAFEERASCVADQYSSYVAVDDVHLNGRLTLGENTADHGGVRIAYMALMENLAESNASKTKDGLTPQQRFFLAYAQAWCRNMSDASLRLMATTDPHSPPKYRVNGTLSDNPDFWNAYKCKPGDKMVRQNACRVW